MAASEYLEPEKVAAQVASFETRTMRDLKGVSAVDRTASKVRHLARCSLARCVSCERAAQSLRLLSSRLLSSHFFLPLNCPPSPTQRRRS
jgi:hypothetical protein